MDLLKQAVSKVANITREPAVFGSKDVSRAVADNAAVQSGLDSGVLRKMLPLLAMLVTGFMAKQAGGAAGPASEGGGSGGLGGLIGSLGGMLDMNGDGNPLDDILRMAGKASG